MRTPGILLLLIVCGTLAYPQMNQQLSAHGDEVAGATNVPMNGEYSWRYSRNAPFHDHLGKDIQEFAASDPAATAHRVCTEFGGEVGHVAVLKDDQTKAAFLCRFTEPDMTMSVDFGELDRIPAP